MRSATESPFANFYQPAPLALTDLRRAITDACRTPETQCVEHLLSGARMPPALAERIRQLALRLAHHLRTRKAGSGRAGMVQGLLQEYALSSHEGIALMCLAEALLRIPDSETRDALIRDKIAQGQWDTHLGQSTSLFVNAATWGLLITGKLVSTHSESELLSALARLVSAGAEPLIRRGVDMAMRMMGGQFVSGQTIGEALHNAVTREQEGFRYSYDMLGEAALTASDAWRYFHAYEMSIHAIGKAAASRGIYEGPGISIKLSALHPRYSRAQYGRVMAELYPRLLLLCTLAKDYDIGLNIDAEESERLELSLDLLEKLCFEPPLQGWNGLGFVVQAYQKRCPAVIDFMIDLARRSQRRLMVRLVKGAYWDAEIKRAQVDGQQGYPVYTRKPYTDAAYIYCARKLLAARDEIYPQFATHNAQTLATIHELADPARFTAQQYEFQCLHGMGEPLYEQVVGDAGNGRLGRPCRVYAPVGTHETLLAYLVRRLLENGANTSFVHQIADHGIALDTLVNDPVQTIEDYAQGEGAVGLPHPAIRLPVALYGPSRRNSTGIDLCSETELRALATGLAAPWREGAAQALRAGPMLAAPGPSNAWQPVYSPADRDAPLGQVSHSSAKDVDAALHAATTGAGSWAATPPAERARMLESAAFLMEQDTHRLMGLLIREAGKTAAAASAEVREAVDFLRYYAQEVRGHFDNATHVPLGPVVCISPWNFPLAIFVGQVAAALAAGNVVLAKPAEQTPLIAAQAVRSLWASGIPRDAVQLLPGAGALVGAQLVQDARVRGVLFTGSTEVAKTLQGALAGRVDARGQALPLIAETGGQNAMVVDSSALAEQVVNDVLVSAFDSAGQRCSALRVLCVQEELADRVLVMLVGAMAELRVGDPARLDTDIGPVIDEAAKDRIEDHISAMRARGHRVHQVASRGADVPVRGNVVTPTVIEIDSISELRHEVFGPVLHFLRYRREALEDLLAQVNATGYALTLGLHTRIDETIDKVAHTARAGNLYVNRNMVGAVVGVQPFGGEGLSGTGPKAGGPLYLSRLLSTRPADTLQRAMGPQASAAPGSKPVHFSLDALLRWLPSSAHAGLGDACHHFAGLAPETLLKSLPGPTGEDNLYSIAPRRAVLCLARDAGDLLVQLAAVLSVGGRAIWVQDRLALFRQLPEAVQVRIQLADEPLCTAGLFDTVLLHADLAELQTVQRQLARHQGPIISVARFDRGDTAIPLERLIVERSLSINTAAAGGNAALMTTR